MPEADAHDIWCYSGHAQKVPVCILRNDPAWKQMDAQRETETSLKKLTVFGAPRSMAPGFAKFKQGPYLDWDWGGWGEPYHGDHDLELNYVDDKVAPKATLDLLALAKLAKTKRRVTRGECLSRKVSLTLLTVLFQPIDGKNPRTLVHVDSPFTILPDLDETSALDYEETWKRVDLNSMDLGLLDDPNVEKDSGSEWDWDRCS
jgi:hypothetical protein